MIVKKLAKRIAGSVLGVTLLVGSMGMTSLAASSLGKIIGGVADSSAYVTLYNQAGNTRYCTVSIKQGNNVGSYTSNVSSNGGIMSSGNSMATSGILTMSHARGYGVIYNSQSSASAQAWSNYTNLK